MVYIDKDSARKIVKKNWPLIEKSISSGEDYEMQVKEAVGWLHFTLLLVRCCLIGAVWLLLNSLDSFLGCGFLLVFAFVQTKNVLDHEFNGVECNIIEAVKAEKEQRDLVAQGEDNETRETSKEN